MNRDGIMTVVIQISHTGSMDNRTIIKVPKIVLPHIYFWAWRGMTSIALNLGAFIAFVSEVSTLQSTLHLLEPPTEKDVWSIVTRNHWSLQLLFIF